MHNIFHNLGKDWENRNWPVIRDCILDSPLCIGCTIPTFSLAGKIPSLNKSLMINARGPLIKSEQSLTSFRGTSNISFAFLMSSFCSSLQASSGVTSLRKKLCSLGFFG